MDIKTIKSEIHFINDAINEEIEMILKHKDRIPRIELDMIMSNIQELYEYFYKLQKLNNKLTTNHLTSIEIQTEKPQIKEKVITEKVEFEKTPVFTEKPKEEKTFIKPILKSVEEVTKTKKNIEPEKSQILPIEKIQPTEKPPLETKVNLSSEKPIIKSPESPQKTKEDTAKTDTNIKPEKTKTIEQKKSTLDLFAENSNTIGDRFLQQKDNSIAASMSHNHISDIKKAIGINEKFLFINELFHGNMQEYNLALDNFNSFETVYEAGQLIDELKSKNNWKTDENPFKQFMDIIKRKYTK